MKEIVVLVIEIFVNNAGRYGKETIFEKIEIEKEEEVQKLALEKAREIYEKGIRVVRTYGNKEMEALCIPPKAAKIRIRWETKEQREKSRKFAEEAMAENKEKEK